MGTVPTVTEVRAWLKVSTSSVSDEVLTDILNAESANQAKACRLDVTATDRDDDLIAALFRRCARQVAARGVPLGIVADAEYGPLRLSTIDAEIERLEGYNRGFYFG